MLAPAFNLKAAPWASALHIHKGAPKYQIKPHLDKVLIEATWQAKCNREAFQKELPHCFHCVAERSFAL